MPDPVNFEIVRAKHTADFTAAGCLFHEYAETLGIDLSFQHFDQELLLLEAQYAPPSGALLLIQSGNDYRGCAGIRKWEDAICELKRMYLRPEIRGMGLGKKLLTTAFETAIALGYKSMRLDSLPGMYEAIQLYRKSGFLDIPPYRINPVEGAVFLEKQLI